MKKTRAIIAAMVGAILMAQPVVAADYSADDLYNLAHVTYAEAGNCGWYMMISVASVVVNRVKSPLFPNTIQEVIFAPGQYAPTWNGTFWLEPSQEAIEVAEYVLENGSQIDESVVWQAEFPQGNGVYDKIESPWGTTMYFCY